MRRPKRILTTLRLLFFMVALGATLAVGVHPSSGQSQTWSDPVLLSNSSQSAWFPDIAVDGSGRIHVVWSASEVGSELPDGRNSIFDLVMYSASDDGIRWTTPMDIIAALHDGGSFATRPSLKPLPGGPLALTYRDGVSIYFTSASSEALTARTLERPHRLSMFQSAYFSQIISDADGGLHLFHTENVPEYPDCPACFHLFYRRSTDGGALWSSLLDISLAPTGAAKPQAVVDADGNLHVVWEAGAGGDLGQLSGPTSVMYASSSDGGQTWSSPIAFVGSGDQQKNIAIGVDGNGQLVVVWLSLPEDRIYYQVSSDQGRSWSMPRPIPGVWGGWSVYSARLDDYDIVTDPDGGMHLTFVGRRAEDQMTLDVIEMSWDGTSWSEPVAAASYEGSVPEWPRMAIGGDGSVHLVWFVRDEEHIWLSDEGQYEVWYARWPALEPGVLQVPSGEETGTPEPVGGVTPLSTELATPLSGPTPPILPPMEQVVQPVPDNESELLLLVLKGITPAIIFITIVVAATQIWRRLRP